MQTFSVRGYSAESMGAAMQAAIAEAASAAPDAVEISVTPAGQFEENGLYTVTVIINVKTQADLDLEEDEEEEGQGDEDREILWHTIDGRDVRWRFEGAHEEMPDAPEQPDFHQDAMRDVPAPEERRAGSEASSPEFGFRSDDRSDDTMPGMDPDLSPNADDELTIKEDLIPEMDTPVAVEWDEEVEFEDGEVTAVIERNPQEGPREPAPQLQEDLHQKDKEPRPDVPKAHIV